VDFSLSANMTPETPSSGNRKAQQAENGQLGMMTV